MQSRDVAHNTTFQFVAAKDEKECAAMPFSVIDSGGINTQGSYPAEYSGSERTFRQIEEWLSACVSDHPNCAYERVKLPKRLLQLRTNTDSLPDRIWLINTEDLKQQEEHVEYVALSYCWGGIATVRSLENNLVHRESHGLRVIDLPAVVRDAITVTLKLGFKFLWVDALCICQDDQEEWEQEAAAMADIYGGSVFTISALSSPDANTSFLRRRNLSIEPIGSIKCSMSDRDDPLKLFIRECPQEVTKELKCGRLSVRAWPLQERILAPGVLHYGRDQVFWECDELNLQSETGEQGSGYGGEVMRFNTRDYRRLWTHLVRDFNRRDLSVFSDRLHAISGLATRLRQIGAMSGRYVAGLWESDLDVLLLWDSARSQIIGATYSNLPAQKNHQIATWSWAHIDQRSYPLYRDLTSNLLAPAQFNFENHLDDMQSTQCGIVVSSCQVLLRGFVQEMNKTFVEAATDPYDFGPGKRISWYPGFRSSNLDLDHNTVGPGLCYSIRMMDSVNKEGIPRSRFYIIEYLLLEQVNPEETFDAAQHLVYKRIGRMSLSFDKYDDPITPYPDILLEEGLPLLTKGEWREIVLI
ncbi:MAG: hypothetical protein Q9220_006597 [cf. Caloplaca sp. 1 TL-2023]